MAKKSFEEKIRDLVKQKEREDKCVIVAVDVVRIKRIGFKRDPELSVMYYTD